MTKRKTVSVLIILLFAVLITAVILYFFVFSGNTKRIVALGETNYKVENFTKSEMKLFDNGTFHIKIIRTAGSTDRTIFIGIGKYTQNGGNYTLEFVSAYGTVSENSLADKKDTMNARKSYKVVSNKIEFIDHNNQVYYFA
jgi:hypothetical protein